MLPVSRDRVDAIECKWRESAFDPKNLELFRADYPHGLNWLVLGEGESIKKYRYGKNKTECITVPIRILRETLEKSLLTTKP